MHHLARNFALQIEKKIEEDDIIDLFGPTLKYKNIYLGKLQDGEIVSVEEFITGVFRKYINNDGLICGEESDPLVQKAACLTHYSYIESKKQVMVVDVQGMKANLFDPEIASALLVDKNEVMFAAGNLSQKAIDQFIESHSCNFFCQCLSLPSLKDQ